MSTNNLIFRDSFPPNPENIYQYSRAIDIKTYNLELIPKNVLKNKDLSLEKDFNTL